MPSVEDIIKLIDTPLPEDIALIRKAYSFAEEIHKNHFRLSGDPVLSHLAETGKLLAEMKLDAFTIAAGLLHDVIEDAGIEESLLEREFGKEVLFIVQGVTKLGKIKYHGAKRYVESLRKFFVAVSKDIRVLLVKFCDRLHNMRTLQFQNEEKKQRIALETLEIYAPLAYRLGIRKISRELENLAFPYIYIKEYQHLKELLQKKKQETQSHLEKFHKMLKKHLAKEHILDFRTNYRLKTLWSLYEKLERKNGDIEKNYDISALRVIVPNVGDCYRVLGIIHSIWRPLPGRIKDYIAFPKPNGYQSLHTTIFIGDGGIIEVQIRTRDMDNQAEYGIVSHIIYKEGKNDNENYSYLSWLINLLPKISNGEREKQKNKLDLKNSPEWLKELAEIQPIAEQQEYIQMLKADFFDERIFVFTPNGDVVDLPVNSCPIDFAYAIHSEIGDHTGGVKVNGKMVSLDTKLKNGDIVEITVREESHPSPKWLDSVKTSIARRKISSFLEKEKKV